MLKEGKCNFDEDTNIILNEMARCIREVTKEVMEDSKRNGPSSKETWWWSDKLQMANGAKTSCHITPHKFRNEEDIKGKNLLKGS